MSVQPAPTNVTSIFNSNSYLNSDQINGDDTLTFNTAEEYFLSYPIAQGYQTMPFGLNVSNGFTIDNINLTDSLTFSDNTIQTSAGLSENTANSLYASLTNNNIISGSNTFSQQIISSNGVSLGSNGQIITNATSQNEVNINNKNNFILGESTDGGVILTQNYNNNPNALMAKFSLQNEGGYSIYDVNGYVMFSVIANGGLNAYRNGVNIFQIDTFGNVRLSGLAGSGFIYYPDGSQQTTAYIPITNLSPTNYTNTNLTLNNKGQITAISNGTNFATSNNTFTGSNTFNNQILLNNGIKFSDNSIQTSAGITQTTANTLFASLTNNNTLSGIQTYNNQINFSTNNSIINNFGGSGSLGFINNNQFNGSIDDGFSFWQAYSGNPNYPIFKYNLQNNGQMLLYNANNQVLFSVTGNGGLNMYSGSDNVFRIDQYGDVYFRENSILRGQGSIAFTAQTDLYLNVGKDETGATGDLHINTDSSLSNTYIDNGNLNFPIVGQKIIFPDATQQTTAYIPQSIVAGSYTNTNLTVNSQGQITSVSNGSTINSSRIQVMTYNSSQTIIPPANTYSLSITIYGSGGIAGQSNGYGSYYVYGGSGAGGNMLQSFLINWNYLNNLTLTCGTGISTTVVFGSLGSAVVGSGGNGGAGQSSGTGAAGIANTTVTTYPQICSWNTFYGQDGQGGGSTTYPYPPPCPVKGGGITNTVVTAGQMGGGQSYSGDTDPYTNYPNPSPYIVGGCVITWYIL